ncbi:MAG: M20/M25/M40 family metallo-hydrolase [Clostridia bacterium]
MKEIIEKLCNVEGVSGFETSASEVAKEILEPYVDSVHIDKMGNVLGYKKSKKENAKTIMLDAHIDQIGFMVTEITDEGFLRFRTVGGVDPRMLLGIDVLVHGKEKIRGVVSNLPPHLSQGAKTAPGIEEMAIDIGFSKEKAEKIVKIGTIVTFAEEVYCLSSDTITGKCLDDRAGVASIIYAMQKLEKVNAPLNILVCFSACEEVDGKGAKTVSFKERPDFAIAVDVTHAKTPDAPANRTLDMGKLCIGHGPNLNPKITKNIIKTCKTYDVPYQLDIMEGHTGTNAWHIQTTRSGIPVGLISFALRYMHTPIETIRISDVKNTGKVIAKFIKDYREEEDD